MKHEYLLQGQDSAEDLTLLNEDLVDPSAWNRKLRFMKFALASQLLVILGLIGTVFGLYLNRGSNSSSFKQALYSPVQHLIEYKTTMFYGSTSTDPKSIYKQPLSPELDDLWENLYKFGITWITKDEASQLVNPTSRLHSEEDHFIAELDVFHQLHCVNILRHAIHWDYYKDRLGEDNLHFGDVVHWDHCIESLRQSLMCTVDVTPLVWQRPHENAEPIFNTNSPHSCRNFENIKQWAQERRIKGDVSFDGVKNMTRDSS